jgi:2-polyprenyl-3-methyl-5-hydroxy-6-metoxy-1,4-benzoquinol methylase
MDFNRSEHWEHIYQTKPLNEVSWFQPKPETSLGFVTHFKVPLNAKIIDIGGGDSLFVDHLLDLGYQDITVLDLSASAIARAKERLGTRANQVTWIVTDVVQFQPTEMYDFWHDRAAFHFLTDELEIATYLRIAQKNIRPDGILILGTFSEQGPKKCSGIEIKQYSEESMTDRLKAHFQKIKCLKVEHKTPFDTLQQFVFCSFKKSPSTVAA